MHTAPLAHMPRLPKSLTQHALLVFGANCLISLVTTVVDELIDGFSARGSADLVRELTFNFPVQVIARILGLPRDPLLSK